MFARVCDLSSLYKLLEIKRKARLVRGQMAEHPTVLQSIEGTPAFLHNVG